MDRKVNFVSKYWKADRSQCGKFLLLNVNALRVFLMLSVSFIVEPYFVSSENVMSLSEEIPLETNGICNSPKFLSTKNKENFIFTCFFDRQYSIFKDPDKVKLVAKLSHFNSTTALNVKELPIPWIPYVSDYTETAIITDSLTAIVTDSLGNDHLIVLFISGDSLFGSHAVSFFQNQPPQIFDFSNVTEIFTGLSLDYQGLNAASWSLIEGLSDGYFVLVWRCRNSTHEFINAQVFRAGNWAKVGEKVIVESLHVLQQSGWNPIRFLTVVPTGENSFGVIWKETVLYNGYISNETVHSKFFEFFPASSILMNSTAKMKLLNGISLKDPYGYVTIYGLTVLSLKYGKFMILSSISCSECSGAGIRFDKYLPNGQNEGSRIYTSEGSHCVAAAQNGNSIFVAWERGVRNSEGSYGHQIEIRQLDFGGNIMSNPLTPIIIPMISWGRYSGPRRTFALSVWNQTNFVFFFNTYFYSAEIGGAYKYIAKAITSTNCSLLPTPLEETSVLMNNNIINSSAPIGSVIGQFSVHGYYHMNWEYSFVEGLGSVNNSAFLILNDELRTNTVIQKGSIDYDGLVSIRVKVLLAICDISLEKQFFFSVTLPPVPDVNEAPIFLNQIEIQNKLRTLKAGESRVVSISVNDPDDDMVYLKIDPPLQWIEIDLEMLQLILRPSQRDIGITWTKISVVDLKGSSSFFYTWIEVKAAPEESGLALTLGLSLGGFAFVIIIGVVWMLRKRRSSRDGLKEEMGEIIELEGNPTKAADVVDGEEKNGEDDREITNVVISSSQDDVMIKKELEIENEVNNLPKSNNQNLETNENKEGLANYQEKEGNTALQSLSMSQMRTDVQSNNHNLDNNIPTMSYILRKGSDYEEVKEMSLKKINSEEKWRVKYYLLLDGRGEIIPLSGGNAVDNANIINGETKRYTFKTIEGKRPTFDLMTSILINQSEIKIEGVEVQNIESKNHKTQLMQQHQNKINVSSQQLPSEAPEIKGNMTMCLKKRNPNEKWLVHYEILSDGRGHIKPLPGSRANLVDGSTNSYKFLKIEGKRPTFDLLTSTLNNQSKIYLEGVEVKNMSLLSESRNSQVQQQQINLQQQPQQQQSGGAKACVYVLGFVLGLIFASLLF